MNINIKEFISASMILFAVIDVIGNMPLILVLREKYKVIESEKASIISLGIMILFLYLGEIILNLLGVDINSFAVAGSIIILFIATEMILEINLYKDKNPKTASIVPIAFLLIAGPGNTYNFNIFKKWIRENKYNSSNHYQYDYSLYGFKIFWKNRKNFRKSRNSYNQKGIWDYSSGNRNKIIYYKY